MSAAHLRNAWVGASAIAVFWSGISPAVAAEDASGQIAEIVVTARKASENLQVTPVAVTALSSDTLATNQVVSISDLQKSAPSLATSTGGPGGPGVIYLAIRGQVNNSGGSGTDSAVATYVDGVYYARPTSGNFGILDAAQAEILRGPQGTLFGRNTTGGALNITTTMPDGKLGGYVRAEYGNYDAMKLEGAVTIPLSGDELSVRVAGRMARRDGYFVAARGGQERGDLANSTEARATIRWAPRDSSFSVTVSGDYMKWNDHGQGSLIRGLNLGLQPVGPLGPTVLQLFQFHGYLNPAALVYRPGENFNIVQGGPTTGLPFIDTQRDYGKTGGVSATIVADVGDVTLKSISAYRRNIAENSYDMDGNPLDLLSFEGKYRQRQYSEELTASGKFGALDLIGGIYYMQEKGSENVVSTPFFLFGVPPQADFGDFKSTSTGLFLQGNYTITDRLRATAGYRYTWDKREVVRKGLSAWPIPTSCTPPIPLTPSGCRLPLSVKFSYPAWTFGLDYKLSDGAFVYAKTSRASMSGGFNLRTVRAGKEAFGPERVTDVELGGKFDMLGGHLRANIALFHSWTDDAQRIVNGLVGQRLSQWNENTGKVRTKGVELELTATPWSGMVATMGGAYLDAKYKAGSFVEDRGLIGPTNPFGGIVDRSGEPIPQAPKWSFNAGLTQTVPLSIGDLVFHADYSYTAKKVIYVTTASSVAHLPPPVAAAYLAGIAEENRLGTLGSYGLFNGSLTLKLHNGLELSVWGRNIGDKEYQTYLFSAYNSIGFTSGNQGNPRTYGASVKFAF